jgi:hypothetical protein
MNRSNFFVRFGLYTYSCVHIIWNKVFVKILITSAEINNTSYESQADFHREKTKYFFFEKPKTLKIVVFQPPQYPIYHLETIFAI